MEKRQRTRLASFGVLTVVFGAGLVLGMAWDVTLDARPASDGERGVAATSDDTDPEEGRRAERRDRGERQYLYEQVGELTPDQETTLDSIVTEYRASMKELHDDFEAEYEPALDSLKRHYRERFEPRYTTIVEEARSAIRQVLTPEQSMRYDSLVVDVQRRREERRRERDGPDPRPD